MKVIGINNSRYSGQPRSFICELSDDEMAILATGSRYTYRFDNANNILEIPISDKWTQAMTVMARLEEAKKLPGMLKSIGETLECIMPQITFIESGPKKDESNFDELENDGK